MACGVMAWQFRTPDSNYGVSDIRVCVRVPVVTLVSFMTLNHDDSSSREGWDVKPVVPCFV